VLADGDRGEDCKHTVQLWESNTKIKSSHKFSFVLLRGRLGGIQVTIKSIGLLTGGKMMEIIDDRHA
jgi:hypothetical protein